MIDVASSRARASASNAECTLSSNCAENNIGVHLDVYENIATALAASLGYDLRKPPSTHILKFALICIALEISSGSSQYQSEPVSMAALTKWSVTELC